MIHNILTPIDGSAHSKKALEFAGDLANKYEAELHLLYVIDNAAEERILSMGSSIGTLETLRENLKLADQEVIDTAKEIAESAGGKVISAELDVGPPARRILDYAKKHKIDTIIMGTRGLSDLTGLMLGSVSHKVSHLSECTCITVR